MTKEDYMRLPKERLAELLVEKDAQNSSAMWQIPYPQMEVPCYAPNGICTNPQMDCIGCPRHHSGGGYVTTTFERKEE